MQNPSVQNPSVRNPSGQNPSGQNPSVQNYASAPAALRGPVGVVREGSAGPTSPPSKDVTAMLTAALAALLLLILLAAAVTVTDAVRSAHWRRVADERRWSWHEQAHGDLVR